MFMNICIVIMLDSQRFLKNPGCNSSSYLERKQEKLK